ncbi:MOSC domain-containing protein [Sulfitobacter sp. 20_GPM-1509m]|uniref:MOSC domain-containing protein n=1 Tax=Sulfitobacter sp. 20_GPM-1509m TaxID=1380367 RepID=UPI00048F480D|nr:MOSC domain-containing protein [Sulfitobacter sp. 20_GPM-1509m]
MQVMADLLARHAQRARVDWIGLRPARRAEVQAVPRVQVGLSGLDGDRARAGKRAVTLIQAEHLPVIAGLLGVDVVTPDALRRNLVISGINLGALKGRDIAVGGAVLRLTVICAPCSRMEETFGFGGYNAVRGHGGWCAEVVTPGLVTRGDVVRVVD